MGNEITIEEKKKKVRDFRPIDDAFFEGWQMMQVFVRKCYEFYWMTME